MNRMPAHMTATGQNAEAVAQTSHGPIATTCLVGGRLGRGSLRLSSQLGDDRVTSSQIAAMSSSSSSVNRSGGAASQRPLKLYANKSSGQHQPQQQQRRSQTATTAADTSTIRATRHHGNRQQYQQTRTAAITAANDNDHDHHDDNLFSVQGPTITSPDKTPVAAPARTFLGVPLLPRRLPDAVQNICRLSRTRGQQIQRFIVQQYLTICANYNLESDWSKMGVRFRFKLIDAVVNLAILSPLTILFYFSTWCLLDKFLLDKVPVVGAWFLLCFGITVETCGGFFQKRIQNGLRRPRTEPEAPIGYNFAAIGFRYVIAFGNASHMKAMDVLVRVYVGEDSYGGFKTLMTTLVLLVSLRCSQSVLAAPLSIGLDTDPEELQPVTTLNDVEADGSRESLLDQLTTHLIVHSAVHANWTGLNCVFDGLLAAIRPAIDVLATYGVSTVVLLFLLLVPAPSSKSSPRPVQALFPYVWLCCGHVATVMWWRAVWMFFDGLAFYFPISHANTDVTCMYAHVLSFFLLAASHVSSTVCALGCAKGLDDVPAFDAEFFSQFFKDEIDRLAVREGEKVEKVEEKVEKVEKTKLDKNHNKPVSSAVHIRKKPKSQAPQETKTKNRTSLEDVVKADHRKKEAKAKEKRH